MNDFLRAPITAIGAFALLIMLSLVTTVVATPTLEWEATVRSTSYGNDRANCIQQTSDAGYIIVGTTRALGQSHDDLWLVKTNRRGFLVWSRQYGGPENDEGLFVRQTADGGYIITGRTASYGIGGFDVWLLKTDAAGELLWSQTFGAPGDDIGTAVEPLSDGYIVAATTDRPPQYDDFWAIRTDLAGELVWETVWDYQDNDDRGTSIQPTADGGFIFGGHCYAYNGSDLVGAMVKLDAAGEVTWTHAYGNPGLEERGTVARQTSDGGYVLTGYAGWAGAGGADVWLVKTDASGAVEWERTYGGSSDDIGHFVMQTDSGYLVAGYTESFGAGGRDYYVIMTDAAGNEQWTRTYGGPRDDMAFGLTSTLDGNFVTTGVVNWEPPPPTAARSTPQISRSIGPPTAEGMLGSGFFTVKFDPTGERLWARRHRGRPSEDLGSIVQPTPDGGFVVTGWTVPAGRTDRQLSLVKTNAQGSVVWKRHYGGSGDEEGWYVRPTPDGGYVAVGNTTSFGAGSQDYWLLKVDGLGETEWTQTYGAAGFDYATAVEPLSDGYILAGNSARPPRYDDVWVIRTDESGAILWERLWDLDVNDDRAHSLQPTDDGGFIVGGHSYIWNGADLVGTLLKLDADGNVQWSHTYGVDYHEERGTFVRTTSDGGYILSGYSGYHGTGDADVWLVKTDAAGDVQWDHEYGGSADEVGYVVAEIPGEGYVVVGFTDSFGAGGRDVYLVGTDLAGAEMWSATYGGPGEDSGYGLALTDGGGCVLSGYFESADRSQDMYLVKLSGLVSGNLRVVPAQDPTRVVLHRPRPNPFFPRTEIPFSLPRTTTVRIDVYDVAGRLVAHLVDGRLEAGIHRATWDGTNGRGERVSGGTYFYRVRAGDRTATGKMVLLR